jgi:hypothetical protein
MTLEIIALKEPAPTRKPVKVRDSTLLRFYDVTTNDAAKKERVDGATPCF